MVLHAVQEFALDLASSYVVGDSDHDLELARRIGAKGVHVSEAFTFPEAVELILKESQMKD
jgi:histidinol phosphatase-like enzyme